MTDYFVNNSWQISNPSAIKMINPSNPYSQPVGYSRVEDNAYTGVADPDRLRHNQPIFQNTSVDDPIYILDASLSSIIGVHLVIVVDDDYTVTVAGTGALGNDTTDIIVAFEPYNGLAEEPDGVDGPFPTLQYSTDNAELANNNTINVKMNNGYKFDDLDQPNTQWDIPTGTGSNTENNHTFIKGYNINIGDMDYNNTYYGGAINAFNETRGWTMDNSDAKWVTIDFDGLIEGIQRDISGSPTNLHIENFHLTNAHNASGYIIGSKGLGQGSTIKNCRFSLALRAVSNSRANGITQDCYFDQIDTNCALWVNSGGSNHPHNVSNCIFDGGTEDSTIASIGILGEAEGGGLIENCLFINNQRGISITGTTNCLWYIKNNTFITTHSMTLRDHRGAIKLRTDTFTQGIYCYNNIFYFYDDKEAINIDKGTYVEVDYNCAYSQNGKLTNAFTDTKNLGSNNIEENPDFVSIDNINGLNLMPKNLNVINNGKKLNGYKSSMGSYSITPGHEFIITELNKQVS